MCAIDGVLNKCLAMDEVGAPQPPLLIGTGIQGGFRHVSDCGSISAAGIELLVDVILERGRPCVNYLSAC